MVGAVVGFSVGTAMVAIVVTDRTSGAHARDQSYWYCLIGGLLACVLLGYALGVPHVWERMWRGRQQPMWQDNALLEILAIPLWILYLAQIACAVVLGAALLVFVLLTEDSTFGVARVILTAGPSYIIASALFSRLRYTRWRQKV